MKSIISGNDSFELIFAVGSAEVSAVITDPVYEMTDAGDCIILNKETQMIFNNRNIIPIGEKEFSVG